MIPVYVAKKGDVIAASELTWRRSQRFSSLEGLKGIWPCSSKTTPLGNKISHAFRAFRLRQGQMTSMKTNKFSTASSPYLGGLQTV
jgi:hypothetical protein